MLSSKDLIISVQPPPHAFSIVSVEAKGTVSTPRGVFSRSGLRQTAGQCGEFCIAAAGSVPDLWIKEDFRLQSCHSGRAAGLSAWCPSPVPWFYTSDPHAHSCLILLLPSDQFSAKLCGPSLDWDLSFCPGGSVHHPRNETGCQSTGHCLGFSTWCPLLDPSF